MRLQPWTASKGCELVVRFSPMHCLTVVWKRCRDGALPICWPLLSCIIPTLFAYFLARHPYIFLCFLSLVYRGLWGARSCVVVIAQSQSTGGTARGILGHIARNATTRTSHSLETPVTFPLHVLHVLLREPTAVQTPLSVNVLLTIYSPSAFSLLATDIYSPGSWRSQNLPFVIVFLPYFHTLKCEKIGISNFLK